MKFQTFINLHSLDGRIQLKFQNICFMRTLSVELKHLEANQAVVCYKL